MVRAWCLQLGLGLGLGLGNGVNSFFFFLCVKVTKTFVLLSWHVTVRPTVCDIMMMYSKEWYMENLPSYIARVGVVFSQAVGE